MRLLHIVSHAIKPSILFATVMLISLGPTVRPVFSAPMAALTVNVTTDLGDATPGDGFCDTDPGTMETHPSFQAACWYRIGRICLLPYVE